MYKRIIIKVILMIICCLIFFVSFLRPDDNQKILSKEEETTQNILKKSKNKSLDQVYKQISQLEQENQKNNSAQNNPQDLNQRFQNALILGDSIAEGLIDYQIISPSHCIGVRGTRVDYIDDVHDEVKRKRPKVIFLEYGMNDLEYCRGNENMFYKRYNEQLQKLKTIAPDAKIYINAILPIDKSAIAQMDVYAKYPKFNEMLKKLCRENKITLIDNSFILKQMKNKYEKDGIHPKYSYYKAWAKNMAEVAGL